MIQYRCFAVEEHSAWLMTIFQVNQRKNQFHCLFGLSNSTHQTFIVHFQITKSYFCQFAVAEEQIQKMILLFLANSHPLKGQIALSQPLFFTPNQANQFSVEELVAFVKFFEEIIQNSWEMIRLKKHPSLLIILQLIFSFSEGRELQCLMKFFCFED